MNYIVFDLESTCWENDRTRTREIIEIGAVKLDENGDVLGEFSSFIKPVIFPALSQFCRALTSISQSDVDDADSFVEVIVDFQNWIDLSEEYLVCSWGHYDRNQLISDSRMHGVKDHWVNRHISLKHQYAELNHLSRPIGMGKALKKERLNLEGTHHRAIDDARNITKIFLKYFGMWKIK